MVSSIMIDTLASTKEALALSLFQIAPSPSHLQAKVSHFSQEQSEYKILF